MINTMEDVDLLLDKIEKNAIVRPHTWDFSRTDIDLDSATVQDYIRYLMKECRPPLKY